MYNMGSNSKQLSITNSVGSSNCKDKTLEDKPGCSVFTAEILLVILDNLKILTSSDLLNFRFVNRCWRDAATKVLLNRKACDIVLDIGQVPFFHGDDVNIYSHTQLLSVDRENWHDPPIFKLYNALPPHGLFPDLIQCISASPKFPSNSIKFLIGCEKVLNNLGLSPASRSDKEDDLMKFFSLHGNDIEKISFPSEISTAAVQNLLFVHLPNLTCLDLRNFELFASHVQDETNIFSFPALPSSPSQELKHNCEIPTLKIETIHLESEPMFYLCKAHLLEEVINSSPNLRAIQDVGLAGLSFLMKMEKAHLTKCLNFDPSENLKFVNSLAELFCLEDKFCTLKLTALTVKLSNASADEGKVTWILNKILKGSQDTLKYLELHVNPEDVLPNILIPQLEKLQCLKLVKEVSEFLPFGLPYENEKEDGPGAAGTINIHVSRTLYDRHVFEFENQENPNRIPPNYFPALSKVTLDLGLGLGAVDRLDTYKNKLLAFFEVEQCGMDVSGDILPSVTTLEMTSFPDAGMALGKLFPNVRHLQIKCDPLTKLNNWVWKAFPKLERFHICDFTASLKAEAIDSFFTGLHQKLCTHDKFGDNNVATTGLEFSPEQIQFLRTEPYIGDAMNLKEFTIHFKDKISKMFVSQLTGLYGFREMVDQTKIIFSFDTVQINEQDRKDIQKHLESVALYIEVRQ